MIKYLNFYKFYYINLFTMKAYHYDGGKFNKVMTHDIGHCLDVLIEKFFKEKPFTSDELTQGVCTIVKTRVIDLVV